MDDLISRQAAIDAIEGIDCSDGVGLSALKCDVVDNAVATIKALPPTQPQRIKGKWERKESELSWWYECSSCGETPLYSPYSDEVLTPFCPWCGAEMRQQEEQG